MTSQSLVRLRYTAAGALSSAQGQTATAPAAPPPAVWVTKRGKRETIAQHEAHVAWGIEWGAVGAEWKRKNNAKRG